MKTILICTIIWTCIFEGIALSRPSVPDSFPVSPDSQEAFRTYYLENIVGVKADEIGIGLKIKDFPRFVIYPEQDTTFYNDIAASSLQDNTYDMVIGHKARIVGELFNLKIDPAPEEVGQTGFVFQRPYSYWDEKKQEMVGGKNSCIVLLLKPGGADSGTKARELYFLKDDVNEARRILKEYNGYVPESDAVSQKPESIQSLPSPSISSPQKALEPPPVVAQQSFASQMPSKAPESSTNWPLWVGIVVAVLAAALAWRFLHK
jgi:hypothetical protein